MIGFSIIIENPLQDTVVSHKAFKIPVEQKAVAQGSGQCLRN